MRKKIDCSVIIINYNTSKLIYDLIRSLQKYSPKYTLEIILIDNASPNDDLRKLVKKISDIKLVINTENLGFGKANNQGISLANGRYILLLNADTLFMDNSLDRCIDFMDSSFATSNNIGLLGCELLNEDRSHQPSTFPKFGLLNYLISSNALLSRIKSKKKLDSRQSKFVAGITGAFMLFRKEVFEEVKPFDPDIFMYSEETELCRERVGKYFNIYYWNGASIIHYGGASSERKLQLQEMVSFSLIWYKKGYFFYVIYICSLIINILTELVLLIFMKGINRRRSWGRVKNFPKLCYYLVFEIPKYSPKWGSRDVPLKAH